MPVKRTKARKTEYKVTNGQLDVNPGAEKKLHQVLAFLGSSQLKNARTLCEDILASQPDQADALHLLGVIEVQVGNCEKAVDLIGQARRMQELSATRLLN